MIQLVVTGVNDQGRVVTRNETQWATRDEALAAIKEDLEAFARPDGSRRWKSPYFPVRLTFDLTMDTVRE